MFASLYVKIGLLVAALAIFSLSILFVYNKGYDAATIEYEKKILEEELKWKAKIDELNLSNEKIFLAYENQKKETEKIKNAKRQELLNYVENDPSFDAIIFNDDILRKLNGN
jgi:hypothetical protein